jgi:sugar fermentation stimulation protein A
MKFKHLIKATIIKRYKRFLADVVLESGEQVTVHVPNTGSMKTCWEEHWPVLLSESSNPDRKLKYTLEMLHNGKTWIGVNTQNPQKLAIEALEKKVIPELMSFPIIQSEVKISKETRIDLVLSNETQKCFVEIKNVTLLGDARKALFPDAVSERGTKHLKELIELKKQGHACAMLYIIQREDVDSFAPAKTIDPVYAQHLKMAHDAGVLILPYQCELSETEIKISKIIPFLLD